MLIDPWAIPVEPKIKVSDQHKEVVDFLNCIQWNGTVPKLERFGDTLMWESAKERDEGVKLVMELYVKTLVPLREILTRGKEPTEYFKSLQIGDLVTLNERLKDPSDEMYYTLPMVVVSIYPELTIGTGTGNEVKPHDIIVMQLVSTDDSRLTVRYLKTHKILLMKRCLNSDTSSNN